MIESRYSIEYIDPNSEKSPSKLGRFFIYSTLTISIFAAITALVFSNLPSSTSKSITHKVQQFISSLNESSTSSPVEEETIASEPEAPIITIENTQENDKNELAEQRLIATQLEDEYKKEIDRLNQENTSQHNEAVKQLTDIQALTRKLDTLSKQFKSGVQKSIQLKKENTSLLTENKSISSLLKKTQVTAKNYADEIKKIEQKEKKVVTQPTITNPVTPESVEIKKANHEAVIVEKETKNTTEDTPTANKNEAPKSQIDAIVAAMEAAKSTSNSATVKK